VAGVVRTQVLRRLFGSGATGAIGAGVASWALDRLSEGIRHDAEVLDVSKLRVGETYTVVTRPAPTRRERKLASRLDAAERKVRAATKPTGPQRRAARALERAQRRAAKARPGTAKAERLQVEADELESRYRRVSRRTPRQLRVIAERDAVRARFEAERSKALAAARRSTRPPRRRTWLGETKPGRPRRG
jgi:hypothetical protein